MTKIIDLIQNNYALIPWIIIFISIFFEITPIRLNPISSVCTWIRKKFMQDTDNKLYAIEQKLDSISNRVDTIEINNIRSEILSFGNSCMNGRRHTREEYDHIIDLHTQYDERIRELGLVNGRMKLVYSYITDRYKDHLMNDDFLDSSVMNKK